MKAAGSWTSGYILKRIALPTLLSAVCAGLVGGLTLDRLEQAHAEAERGAFTLETREMALRINERVKAYRQVLRGARALILASSVVTREEWRDYVVGLRLDADYPGIQGVGMAVPIAPQDLARHEQQIRTEGFPDYRVTPPGPREHYSAIVLLEPFDWRNQRAFGYDMYSEPTRREAMERALALGTPALTGKVSLVQETATDRQAGVLLYLPVFKPEMPLGTQAERERAFIGWVYSPFRMNDLITGTLGDSEPRIRVRIYDGRTPTPDQLLFDSHTDGEPPGALFTQSLLELDSRVWTLRFDSIGTLAIDQQARDMERIAVILIGSLFVLLTASLLVTRERARALALTGASLQASEARYSTLVNLSQDGIAALDAELRFTFLNPRLIALLGYPEQEILGKRLDRIWAEQDKSRSAAVRQRLRRGVAASAEQTLRKASGELLTAIITDAPHLDADGHLQGVILTVTDISERKESEERIHYLATHDTLTGLANRAMFLDLMDTSLLIARRNHSRVALLYLDLDHFKEVNDRLGHASGDALLIEVARRMRGCLRASDLLARQGGDEFMALLQDVGGMQEAMAVAEKIRAAIDAPYHLENGICRVSVCIGIALYPDHGEDLDSLSRRADEAMYRAKDGGRNGVAQATLASPSGAGPCNTVDALKS